MSHELRKSYPYGNKRFDDIYNHPVSIINYAKQYMRDAGYNPGKDRTDRKGILYKIYNFGRAEIDVIKLPFILKNDEHTTIADLYYFDLILYYINLAKDGISILDFKHQSVFRL